MAAGDAIVAVDGRPAADFSRADLVALTSQAAGTRLNLRVKHGASERDVTLTLS